MHPLLFIALVTKQHIITFNHSILSEINYPHIHLLNCHHTTSIEDLFLFFASPTLQQQQNSSNNNINNISNNITNINTSMYIKSPESNSIKTPTSPQRLSLNYDQINLITNSIQNSINNNNINIFNSNNLNENEMLNKRDSLVKQHKRSSSLAIDNLILNSNNNLNNNNLILNNNNLILNNGNDNLNNGNNSLPPSSNILQSNNENQQQSNMEKRNSFKHNKNIFSFDDRYHQVFNDTNNNNNNNNNTNNTTNNVNSNNAAINSNNAAINSNNNTLNISHTFHHNVHSLNDGNISTTPSTPFNQSSQLHVPFSLQKRTSILSKRHFKHVSNSPTVSNNNSMNNTATNMHDNIFDLQVKTNERKFKILILNNFRTVSKRVKFTLLEIFKYKKVILGEKIIDIPYEFICICDTLELPSPLLNEFIGFVPTLCANTTITTQDIQNYSTNIQHIIQQQLNRLNDQTNLIDCVDMTVKLQQYIREIIIQCRNHQYIKKYPTSETLPFTVMACKAYALIYNKTFVTPTHVQSIISNLLYHRIECISEDKWNVIQQVVSNVLPP